jgi:hypothetical protein
MHYFIVFITKCWFLPTVAGADLASPSLSFEKRVTQKSEYSFAYILITYYLVPANFIPILKMRITILVFSVFIFSLVSNAQIKSVPNQKNQRIEKVINSQWTFNYFPTETADKGYEGNRFDDSKWPAISIPHVWNTYETTGELNPFIRNVVESENIYWWIGWGWYRKHFSISRDYSDKKIFIEFEGVQKYCKVWLNGKFLGDHKGGYGSFDFDITGLVKPGEDNVLAVAVNNTQNDQFKIPPMAAENLNVYGGIFRNVTLVLKNKLYIPMQGSASHEGGTFVTTAHVSEKEGLVQVQTWVKNDNPQKKTCTLQTSILDATNKVIQVVKSDAVLNPGQLYKFDHSFKPVKNPHLWSNIDPYLYRVSSEVLDGKEITDSYNTPLGFRWFGWDTKENALYLNGKKVLIRGENRHQEYPWLGGAIPEWLTALDFLEMSGTRKYNFMRTADYPNDKFVYELADKYGIVIAEEFPVVRNQNYSVEIHEQQIKEMIRRDRNHPSIISWSGTNISGNSDSKYIMAEDTTRSVRVNSILADSLTSFFGFKKNSVVASQTGRSGEPAKIVLSGSAKKLKADRGSVAIITADIVDSQGINVKGATNTIKWNISGPAILVGPSVFVSDIVKHDKLDGVWYIDMPVSNVLRSTGKPGTIHISVFASGLASGSFDIEAEEIKPDNSVVVEPVLLDDVRKPVDRIELTANRLEDVPQELNQINEEFKPGLTDKAFITKTIRDYIFKNNHLVDTTTIEFKTLLGLLSSHLTNNNGRISAEDFNFNAGHYNNCRLISGYISATKLPPLFKEALKQHYANLIIRLGNEKNAGDEMNWLNWIPSGGTVVISTDKNSGTYPKGTIITTKTQLIDLIALVYPVFPSFSSEAKERALTFTSKMNPYIRVSSNKPSDSGGGRISPENISYTADKGQPILIPLLKFISE